MLKKIFPSKTWMPAFRTLPYLAAIAVIVYFMAAIGIFLRNPMNMLFYIEEYGFSNLPFYFIIGCLSWIILCFGLIYCFDKLGLFNKIQRSK